MSWAVSLANRRYTVEQIHRALAAKPSGRRDPGSIKYQRLLETRGLDAAEAYVWRTARKALDFVRANPKILDPAEGTLAVLATASLAGALPWGLYGGSGPRRALEAAFVIGERVGDWPPVNGSTCYEGHEGPTRAGGDAHEAQEAHPGAGDPQAA